MKKELGKKHVKAENEALQTNSNESLNDAQDEILLNEPTDGNTDPTIAVAATLPINRVNEENLPILLEAVLLAANKPMSKDELLALFEEHERPSKEMLTDALHTLIANTNTEHRGARLAEIASGFQFQVNAQWAPWVSQLWEEKAPRYSRALLETLALIAYRQPITRGEIEDIRGVSISQSIFKTLGEEREWIRVVGHREVPGRPALYATTKAFLDYFGLKNLEELPSLPDILNLDEVTQHLETHVDGKVEKMLERNARILEMNIDGEYLNEEEPNTDTVDSQPEDTEKVISKTLGSDTLETTETQDAVAEGENENTALEEGNGIDNKSLDIIAEGDAVATTPANTTLKNISEKFEKRFAVGALKLEPTEIHPDSLDEEDNPSSNPAHHEALELELETDS